ncbi:hypothetical protein scyTo_0021163 [Scyliorhinus torazame]|uniref:STAT transcription factor protein interaction domain-containing protein n=1 Tax=Scyliorhinus torazame TaxID=75743 RepID=A0A401PY52_SCYTO|nr:hypothetical protein [Scyliorhinus torazame]
MQASRSLRETPSNLCSVSSIHINPTNENLARNLLDTMVSELQKVSSCMSYPVKCKLSEYAVVLKKTFDQQPLELVNIMTCLLVQENQLFQELRQTLVSLQLSESIAL